jgi:peptide-methionine (S)-S-oxide reductase
MELSQFNTHPWTIAFLLIATAIHATPSGATDGETAHATLAAGCFWCIEADLEKVEGVLSVTSGYTGGTVANPTYKQVSAGTTGHTEAVRVVFDPRVISYEELLAIFWRNVDPTVADRQFCDVGEQYRAGIFYHDEEQRAAAEKSRASLERTKPFSNPIVTEITAATAFYPAKAYHQDYYKKNPIRYSYYRKTCGRDRRLKEIWGEKP